jgi:hypothetical protein
VERPQRESGEKSLLLGRAGEPGVNASEATPEMKLTSLLKIVLLSAMVASQLREIIQRSSLPA